MSAHIGYGVSKWENLKPSALVRLCRGRQTMGKARLSCLHHETSICNSDVLPESYSLLQRYYLPHLSHPTRAGKNVCSMPRGRIQDSEVLAWEKKGRVPDGARQTEWEKSFPESGKSLDMQQSRRNHREITGVLFFTAVFHLPHQQDLKVMWITHLRGWWRHTTPKTLALLTSRKGKKAFR